MYNDITHPEIWRKNRHSTTLTRTRSWAELTKDSSHRSRKWSSDEVMNLYLGIPTLYTTDNQKVSPSTAHTGRRSRTTSILTEKQIWKSVAGSGTRRGSTLPQSLIVWNGRGSICPEIWVKDECKRVGPLFSVRLECDVLFSLLNGATALVRSGGVSSRILLACEGG